MNTRLFAYLSYRDARAAIDWLVACGFETVRRIDGDDGRVVHSEMRLGEAVVIVSSNDLDYDHAVLVGEPSGHGIYLMVPDVDAVYARAVAAGATPVIEPEDTEWTTRRARVYDPEGIEWSFGSYEPGQR
ncbi:VOC family protein [Conyzicola sp.]|uniref:VOC family protein n=1 Tax=Conyzicola sp. TaxID=1969404 RepID=UPI0039895A01